MRVTLWITTAIHLDTQIAMPDPTQDTSMLRWLESLHKVMGKERAAKFAADLAATKPSLAEAFLVAADRASTGEVSLAITLLINVVTFGQKGAPMDYVRLPTMMGTSHYITLSKRRRTPTPAKRSSTFSWAMKA